MANAKTTIRKINETEWEVIKLFKNGRNENRIVNTPIDIWLIGNTGVRNPWRIPSGFKVYVESKQVGRLREPHDQLAFKKILFDAGEIGGDPEKDKDASITRKYRLMFNKYGFTYPGIITSDGFKQEELGAIDEITPAGMTFYHANTIQAQQECFLRGLIVPMELLDGITTFSPLLWVLQIIFRLFERTGNYKINFIEFAVCVQTSTPKFDIDSLVTRILEIRNIRKITTNKKKFDQELVNTYWKHYLYEEINFRDYADMNLRYLTSTGILKRDGRALTLVEEYKSLAFELSKNAISTTPLKERYLSLCKGAQLPTDNLDIAYQVLKDLIDELNKYNIEYELPNIPLDTPQNVNIARMRLKLDIDHFKEEEFARNQINNWLEIYEYMQLLIKNNGRPKEMDEDYVIKVPKSEAPAYFEWVLWRAFLAIDHIHNKPYESRGFNIDQDYLPVGTSPGGRPDMIFEFADYVIVVEVTLTSNSRQEAMEGEPVRRHVADLMMKYYKPVYGLFVANTIDSNTAETFRVGVWYTKNDLKLDLHIIPLTLSQFGDFFRSIFSTNRVTPDVVVSLLKQCESYRGDGEAPCWKLAIAAAVNERIESYCQDEDIENKKSKN
jgi:hypothetical protein